MVDVEVPQLKPDENQAALAACVGTIMQTALKNTIIISAFYVLNSKGVLMKDDSVVLKTPGNITNFVLILTDFAFIQMKVVSIVTDFDFITAKVVFIIMEINCIVTKLEFIMANLEIIATVYAHHKPDFYFIRRFHGLRGLKSGKSAFICEICGFKAQKFVTCIIPGKSSV